MPDHQKRCVVDLMANKLCVWHVICVWYISMLGHLVTLALTRLCTVIASGRVSLDGHYGCGQACYRGAKSPLESYICDKLKQTLQPRVCGNIRTRPRMASGHSAQVCLCRCALKCFIHRQIRALRTSHTDGF